MTDEDIKEFLIELTNLSQKHSIGIGGCGCCSSPYLFDLGKSDTDKEYYVSKRGNLELK